MNGFTIINIDEIIKSKGEESIKGILSSFLCPKNPDIEDFIKNKAIEFSKQSISRTFLVFASHQEKQVLTAYFTLSLKTVSVSNKNITKAFAKRLKKFAVTDDNETLTISTYLIGQLSKNFRNGYDQLIKRR